MAKIMISLGADVHKRDAYGWTAVHHVAGAGTEMVPSPTASVSLTHFLAAAGADINTVDSEGQTALHIAAAEGNSDLCW